MADIQTGGCHCGAVRFSVKIDLAQPVIECNCSYCAKKGPLLGFVPRALLSIDAGEDQLTEYRFNTHKIAHRFCKVCGVQPFGFAVAPDGTDGAAINARCIDGVDLDALDRRPFNGRDI